MSIKAPKRKTVKTTTHYIYPAGTDAQLIYDSGMENADRIREIDPMGLRDKRIISGADYILFELEGLTPDEINVAALMLAKYRLETTERPLDNVSSSISAYARLLVLLIVGNRSQVQDLAQWCGDNMDMPIMVYLDGYRNPAEFFHSIFVAAREQVNALRVGGKFDSLCSSETEDGVKTVNTFEVGELYSSVDSLSYYIDNLATQSIDVPMGIYTFDPKAKLFISSDTSLMSTALLAFGTVLTPRTAKLYCSYSPSEDAVNITAYVQRSGDIMFPSMEQRAGVIFLYNARSWRKAKSDKFNRRGDTSGMIVLPLSGGAGPKRDVAKPSESPSSKVREFSRL
jgi:hypothetical protein